MPNAFVVLIILAHRWLAVAQAQLGKDVGLARARYPLVTPPQTVTPNSIPWSRARPLSQALWRALPVLMSNSVGN
jgi:hypothetical protein